MSHTDTASEAGKLKSVAIKSYEVLLSGSTPANFSEQSATGFMCLVICTGTALPQKGLERSEGLRRKGKSSAVA